jgi:hypothetical protein
VFCLEKKLTFLTFVSPAYGFSALALVKCSNEGGPGPRHNKKENTGSSTLIMLKEHGCHLYLMPWFSEAGDNRNIRMGLPPSPQQPGQSPLPPPSSTHSTPCHSVGLGQPRRKHTSASGTRSEATDWARGGWGDHCELFSSSLGGQTAELVTSAGWPVSYPIALPSRWMWNPWQASTTRQVNGRPVPQDRSMAGRYRTGVYIRNPLVPTNHSATTLGGDHTSRHQG